MHRLLRQALIPSLLLAAIACGGGGGNGNSGPGATPTPVLSTPTIFAANENFAFVPYTFPGGVTDSGVQFSPMVSSNGGAFQATAPGAVYVAVDYHRLELDLGMMKVHELDNLSIRTTAFLPSYSKVSSDSNTVQLVRPLFKPAPPLATYVPARGQMLLQVTNLSEVATQLNIESSPTASSGTRQ